MTRRCVISFSTKHSRRIHRSEIALKLKTLLSTDSTNCRHLWQVFMTDTAVALTPSSLTINANEIIYLKRNILIQTTVPLLKDKAAWLLVMQIGRIDCENVTVLSMIRIAKSASYFSVWNFQSSWTISFSACRVSEFRSAISARLCRPSSTRTSSGWSFFRDPFCWMQCAAVKTCFSVMRLPPQKNLPLEARTKAAKNGNCPRTIVEPPRT